VWNGAADGQKGHHGKLGWEWGVVLHKFTYTNSVLGEFG